MVNPRLLLTLMIPMLSRVTRMKMNPSHCIAGLSSATPMPIINIMMAMFLIAPTRLGFAVVSMIEVLIRDGGDIDAIVVETASQRPIDDDLRATESGLGEIPFGDADSGERPGPERGREGGSEPKGGDSGRLPAEERGADGEGERDGVAPASKATRIEDFGEKIAGARKDVWASYADQMRGAAEVDVSAEPLSKSWPAPDYEKLIEAGVEPWKVSFMRAARDSIPTKPQKSWRLSGWVDAVTGMRGLAQDVMDGNIDQDKLRQALLGGGKRSLGEILGQMKLYDAVGHGKSLKGMSFGEVSYSMLSGVRYQPHKVFWEVSQKAKAASFSNMPDTIARAETEAEAVEQFKRAYGGLDEQRAKAQKARKWLVYSHDGRKYFSVGTKIGSTYIQLRRVDDVKEARRIVAEESDALQEQLDRLRDIPADRRSENAPRVGIDHRSGADATPDQFGETFGFRGVQFGNWVSGNRRQQDLNDAYDALMDLAGVLDIPPRALSLNGTLGLAFGARGSGGVSPAAAHYEPDQVVINLTKMNGAGSLAHEWFHALDNYFARAATDNKGGFITDRAISRDGRVGGVRPEVMDALVVLHHAIGKTGLKARSENIDKTRSKAYWSTGIEMHARAFESYVIAKLQDQSISNDYLANVVEGTAWQMQAELSGLGDSYPYLKPDEIETVRPAFDAVFDAIQTRETESGIEMYQRDLSEPVATLTGDELGEWADIRQLGKKATAWYRQNLLPEGEPVTVTNAETGWTIEFNKKGASKIGGRKGEDLYRAVVALPDILRHGKLVETEADSKGRPDIKAVHKIAAKVRIAGRDMNLIATIRETRDGKFHYDLSKDRAGDVATQTADRVAEARSILRAADGEGRSETALRHGDAKLRSSALEGALAELNLDFADAEIKPFIPTSALRDLTRTVQAVLRDHGIARAISPKIVRVLLDASGVPVFGSYSAGRISVGAGAVDPVHTMRHEIIHALRDDALWGRPYGLFTQAEWTALARAARRNAALREAVETAYPNLSTRGQTEEMIAEMYADWARDRDADPPGPVREALERIRSFFRALVSALRGDGFVDAARVLDRIASGEVGGRGPDGPGAGRGDANSLTMYQSVQTAPVQIDPTTAVPVVTIEDAVPDAVDWRGEREWLRENLQGKEFVASDGVPVRISGISKKLTSSNTGNPIKQAAIRNLPRLIESAVVYSREADDKGRDNLSYAYAAIVARIGGEDYSVSLSYRVDGEAKRAAYQLLGYEMGKRSGGSSGDLAEASSDQPTPERNHRIADVVGDFNRGNPPLFQRDLSELKEQLSRSKGRALGMIGDLHWKRTPKVFGEWLSNFMTDRMGADSRWNILGLVPGHALFTELGKGMPAAQEWRTSACLRARRKTASGSSSTFLSDCRTASELAAPSAARCRPSNMPRTFSGNCLTISTTRSIRSRKVIGVVRHSFGLGRRVRNPSPCPLPGRVTGYG
ncbi:MAG: LPD5 domain-containing protein [Paracoccus sp. (in: a-proteobacteria)]|uniref:LPD3 domain-containing protein n=1 Tax=Paracoccus sp. TaxID=267 RepID=UPI0039E4BD8D